MRTRWVPPSRGDRRWNVGHKEIPEEGGLDDLVKGVDRPWGYEMWFAHTDKYAGKYFVVYKGHRLSLQYHQSKHETIYVDRGLVKFTIENEEGVLQDRILEPGESIEVPSGIRHRTEALEESRLFEVSTPELDDVVRVEDDYGR